MEQKAETPNGLPNLGNTCFMGATLQCLNAVWSDHFRTGRYGADLEQLEESASKDLVNLAHVYAYLVSAVENGPVENSTAKWSPELVRRYLTVFRRLLIRFPNSHPFLTLTQQDAHDFLLCLVDIIEKGLSYPNKITITKSPTLSEDGKRRLTSFESWKQHFNDKSSWVVENMYGQYITTLKCAEADCKGYSEAFDAFCYIHLPIEGHDSLESAMSGYIKSETLSDEDAWMCNTCNVKTRAEKTISLWHTPRILIIQFKRFHRIGHMLRKDGKFVSYPIKDFDITKWLFDQEAWSKDPRPHGQKYDLVAICNHGGGMGGGHYTAFRKVGDTWYLFDDATVYPIGSGDEVEKRLVTSSAYYLVYRATE